MPLFVLQDGVSEREPTLISDSAFQDCDGTEYRVGEMGPFVARGRDLVGTISGVTGIGLYEAGFDGSAGFLIAQAGTTLYSSPIAASLSFSAVDSLPSGSSAMVGVHYANRHYLATWLGNRRLERSGTGVTTSPIGMSASTFTVGTSVTQGVGVISATTGLVYWVTEYDSVRGEESVTGSSANTGAFSLKNGIVVTATGTSQNRRSDKLRWYRSVDGGGYPDGGMVRETAIGTTQITDTLSTTGSLNVPLYGLVTIGGLDNDRDAAPPTFSMIFGPFQDSLLGVDPTEPRNLRFTPAGFPGSWPANYGIPLEAHRRDEIVAGVVLPERAGVFCNDSVHVIFRLPRDSDSVFAAGEMQHVVTDQRGCVSARGACIFTPPASPAMAMWVARDGIWYGSLLTSPSPVTDRVNWNGRVDVSKLSTCRLTDDPINRRIVFLYRKATDTTHNTGVWYLDYQEFSRVGIRVTFADHGPLVDAVTIAASDGNRRLASLDSRSGNGQVYLESVQDVDDSQIINSSGSVRFRLRTKEYMLAGPQDVMDLGNATWMHDAGPSRIEHRFYKNRNTNPEVKNFSDPTTRTATDVFLGAQVNSLSLEIESAGATSYGIHWLNIDVPTAEDLGGRQGA